MTVDLSCRVKARTFAKFGAIPLIAVAALGLTGAPSAQASPGASRSAHVSADVFHMQQTSPGNWTGAGWQAFDGSLDTVAAATNRNRRVELFGVNSDGVIFDRVQSRPGNWVGSCWLQIGSFNPLR